MTKISDRALVPLKPSDFRVLQGERRLSDVRLAERLGFDNDGLREIRRLTARWAPFLEQQSGKPCHRASVSRARGPAADAYWYTVPELIFIAGQSKARNAPVVQYEAAQLAAYFVSGEQPPADAAPTIRALAAPDLPKVAFTVARTTTTEQPTLFDEPTETTPPTEQYASTWAGEVRDEVEPNPLIGERTPPASWGKPLTKNKAHHLRKTDSSFLCQCFMSEGKLVEFLIAREPIRAVDMHERLLLRNDDQQEFLCRFDWGVSALVAQELLALERECERSPLSDRQAEAVLTLLLG